MWTRKVVISLVTLATAAVLGRTPPLPEWPTSYKACISMQTDQGYIPVGWYVDTENRKMRLDSYGITSDKDFTYISKQDEPFEYACESLGEPLHVFLYHYNSGKEYDVSPAMDPPYKQCTIINITNPFPPNPLLSGLVFVGQSSDNFTTFYHWRAEYFLFTVDYLFHVANGLPYKLFMNAEEQQFLSIQVTDFEEDVFLPPNGVHCHWG